MSEKGIRQAARSLYKVAEMQRMARLAQEGRLAEYLVSKEVRKVQNKVNRKLRQGFGLKF